MVNGGFLVQVDALIRKNLTFQKKNKGDVIVILVIPIILAMVIGVVAELMNAIDTNGVSEICEKDPAKCFLASPPKWPPLLQVPSPENRAVRTGVLSLSGLPDSSCKEDDSCPITMLVTGKNQSLGQSLAGSMFTTSSSSNSSDPLGILADLIPGSNQSLGLNYLGDPGFMSGLYSLQNDCDPKSSFSVPWPGQSQFLYLMPPIYSLTEPTNSLDLQCVKGLPLWCNSSTDISDTVFKGFYEGNSEKEINEISAAYDFLDSDSDNFNVNIWYNASYLVLDFFSSLQVTGAVIDYNILLRVPRLVNLASNAYLQTMKGSKSTVLFEFLKEMPKLIQNEYLSVSYTMDAYTGSGVVAGLLALFQIVLKCLVYEKQRKVRIMMKMHGLRDNAYWATTYAYFCLLCGISMTIFVVAGLFKGVGMFTQNDFGIQLLFYIIFGNLVVSMAFLSSSFISDVRAAQGIGLFLVLLNLILPAEFYFPLLMDPTVSRTFVMVLEFFPPFALFRGVYELREYAKRAERTGDHGMQWLDLGDETNGMREVMIIMFVEGFIFLLSAYYIDQVFSPDTGVRKSPLFFLLKSKKKRALQSAGKDSAPQKQDLQREREKVVKLMIEPSPEYVAVVDSIRKVYPGKDGNPEKHAVRGLSLAVSNSECLGMLGPTGAGKTSFLSMMMGLTEPSSGTAYIDGLDITTDMDQVYSIMGVCPQFDLQWDCLTGREHLLFYGRLKNLSGDALNEEVEKSLKSLSIFHGGVADKEARQYSGGMRRRLSVAIALIGDPKIVYLDEPSTGLDPASRNNLWNVVRQAKHERGVILTTHSMEEAEALCDRLGIFVNGKLQCIGYSKELKARYGGTLVLAVTSTTEHDSKVEEMVKGLSPKAKKIYHLSGTQKYELPKHEVKISDIFEAVEKAKQRFTVHAWGVSDTTLEDVFIRVAQEALAADSDIPS